MDIKHLLQLAESELINYNFLKASSILPTDIEHLNKLSDYISTYSKLYHRALVILIYNMSISPFIGRLISNKSSLEQVTIFLSSTLNKEKMIDKYIYKILAYLIKNSKDSESIVNVKSMNDIYMLGNNTTKYNLIGFNQIIFYHILKELSRIAEYQFLKEIRISLKDSTILKRLKIKILSYQNITAEEYNHLTSFLNDKNTQLGWTLGKAIVKIITSCSSLSMINSLIFKNESLFAHESKWINTAQILGFLILKKNEAIDQSNKKFIVLNIVQKMIFYENRIESKSESVREAGLFLMWSFIRSDCEIDADTFLKNLLLVTLLDYSLLCRRSACTVMMELFQRIYIINNALISDLINYTTVKRYANCVSLIEPLIKILPGIKNDFIQMSIENIYDNRKCTYLSIILSKYCTCLCSLPNTNATGMNLLFGLSCLLNAFVQHNLCENCMNTELIKPIINLKMKSIYDEINFMQFVPIYAISMEFLLSQNIDISENILFLLDKNICPVIISKLARKIQDSIFKKMIFTNLIRKNNEAYILANAYNFTFKEQLKEKFNKTLQGTDAIKKAAVIESITLSLFDEEAIIDKTYTQEAINYLFSFVTKFSRNAEKFDILDFDINDSLVFYSLLGLEDYSVYIKGDAGYYARKASLEFIAKLNHTKIFDLYFIRYFVEKSYKLRNETLYLFETHGLNGSLKFFFQEYESNMTLLKEVNNSTDEECHFMSCFNAFDMLEHDHKEQFILGILSTYRNCDGFVHKFISAALQKNIEKIYPFILSFIKLRKRYRFLSIYFLKHILLEMQDINKINVVCDIINEHVKIIGDGEFSLLVNSILELRKINQRNCDNGE